MSDEITAKARQLGVEHAKSAVSWFFDGNTSNETYRRYLTGIENGDPEIMDELPDHGLSGEMGDGFSSRDLERALGFDSDSESGDFGYAADVYADAFSDTVLAEVTRIADEMLN